jgi:hypothetical protein
MEHNRRPYIFHSLSYHAVQIIYQNSSFLKERDLYSGFFAKFPMSYHYFLVVCNVQAARLNRLRDVTGDIGDAVDHSEAHHRTATMRNVKL